MSQCCRSNRCRRHGPTVGREPNLQLRRGTRIHYNYFRDYDPQVGRYVESDPLGLGAGINTYAYASLAPTMRIDLTGLVDWNGTATIGGAVDGVGATLARFSLESECRCGKKISADVIAVWPIRRLRHKTHRWRFQGDL